MKWKNKYHVLELIAENCVTILRTKTGSLFTLYSRSFMVTNGWSVAPKGDTSARKAYRTRKQQRSVQLACRVLINLESLETLHITPPKARRDREHKHWLTRERRPCPASTSLACLARPPSAILPSLVFASIFPTCRRPTTRLAKRGVR